jgi:hypothetical protein
VYAPRLYSEDIRPAEWVSWGLTFELNSAREAEKKWRYSWVSWVEFFTGGCDKSTWGPEAEDFPLLEAVARKRLVKTEKT